MAGKNETPRQKMIGMMYLVLTSLLALQVSNAVLEKFAIVNETLAQLVADSNKQNANQLAAIQAQGGKSQMGKIKDAVDKAVKVRQITADLLSFIDNLKKEMIKTTGQPEINEALISDHSSKVASMMIDTRNSPYGKQFEDKLNDYVKQLGELSGESFSTLAKAPKDIPLFANSENHKRKDFLTFTFENTPAIAALTSVTQTETQVLAYEGQALRKLAELVGAAQVQFESIIPMVRPVSSIVAAGAPYEADMFISASSSALSPEMAVDGKAIPVELDPATGIKMGRVKFTAQGGSYDKDNLAKKTFTAQITLKDSTYTQVVDYYVAKPVIRVTTGSRPTLYMGACNPVNFEVPSLGNNYNPTISATGASVVKGDRPGAVTIVPNQRKVTVAVNNAGIHLGDEQFDVKPIPLPRLVAKDNNGRDIDLKNGVRSGSLAGLRIVPEPDESFKEFAPQDANYRIRDMEVILARGTARVQTINATSENVDLGAWRSQMRPGDRIVLDVKTVMRFPCSGSPEKVPMDEVINIPVQ